MPNLAKMAAILKFCQICQKGILFTFSFAICILLAVYFSKYLQFPLSTIRNCQNHVNDNVAIENSDHWICKFFIFGIFFFSTLEDFSEKTYEKTCRFYNKFSKSSSNCTRLRSFTIWIFFSKMSWPFQFNVHFFHFPPLLRENLWKDVPILWLISKRSIIMCTFTKFCHRKVFFKKTVAVSIF